MPAGPGRDPGHGAGAPGPGGPGQSPLRTGLSATPPTVGPRGPTASESGPPGPPGRVTDSEAVTAGLVSLAASPVCRR
eukprot:759563-Hanusia_phi.AAC.1